MKTTEPTRVGVVGDSAISTMPAARVSGAVAEVQPAAQLGLDVAQRLGDRVGDGLQCVLTALAHAPSVFMSMNRTRRSVNAADMTRGDDDHPNGYASWSVRVRSTGGGLEAGTAPGPLPGVRGPDAPPDARRTSRKHVGVMLDGNRRWAKAVGARHRPRPPGRRRQHRAAARLVRRGRHRGRHAVAALDRQPQPAGRTSSTPLLEIIEDAVESLADAAPLAAAPGGRARPAAVHDRREAQGRRGGHPRRRRDARQRRRRVRRPPRDRRRRPLPAPASTPAGAPRSRSSPRSSTSSTSPTTSTPRASPTPTW